MGVTLNHTGFVVTDIERALAFYCDGIGLSVRFQVEAGGPQLSQLLGYDDVQVKAAFVGGIDGHSLEIIEYVSPRSEVRDAAEQHRRNVTGAAHLSFNVESIDDVLDRIVRWGRRSTTPGRADGGDAERVPAGPLGQLGRARRGRRAQQPAVRRAPAHLGQPRARRRAVLDRPHPGTTSGADVPEDSDSGLPGASSRQRFAVAGASAGEGNVEPRKPLGQWLVENVPRGTDLDAPSVPEHPDGRSRLSTSRNATRYGCQPPCAWVPGLRPWTPGGGRCTNCSRGPQSAEGA